MRIEEALPEALRRAVELEAPPPGGWTRFQERRHRARIRRSVSFVGVAAVLAAAAIVVPQMIAGPNPVSPVRPAPTPTSPSPTDGTDGQYFEGTIHGWRIGANGDGLAVNLDCEARRVSAETTTDLDFRITYLPNDIGTPAHPTAVEKWICGDMGLSVTYNFDWDDNPYEGIGTLRVERALYASRARALYAPTGLVEPCSVRGHPAVCVHYQDDGLGRGPGGTILIIEDDELDPFATALLVTDATGIPFHELLKIAEGIR